MLDGPLQTRLKELMPPPPGKQPLRSGGLVGLGLRPFHAWARPRAAADFDDGRRRVPG
jgi:hypothetical protein